MIWTAFWLLYFFIRHLEKDTGVEIAMVHWGILFVLSLGAGAGAGLALARGLMESTGLLSSYLMGPSMVIFVVGLLVLQRLTAQMMPSWRVISFYIIVAIWDLLGQRLNEARDGRYENRKPSWLHSTIRWSGTFDRLRSCQSCGNLTA